MFSPQLINWHWSNIPSFVPNSSTLHDLSALLNINLHFLNEIELDLLIIPTNGRSAFYPQLMNSELGKKIITHSKSKFYTFYLKIFYVFEVIDEVIIDSFKVVCDWVLIKESDSFGDIFVVEEE